MAAIATLPAIARWVETSREGVAWLWLLWRLGLGGRRDRLLAVERVVVPVEDRGDARRHRDPFHPHGEAAAELLGQGQAGEHREQERVRAQGGSVECRARQVARPAHQHREIEVGAGEFAAAAGDASVPIPPKGH